MKNTLKALFKGVFFLVIHRNRNVTESMNAKGRVCRSFFITHEIIPPSITDTEKIGDSPEAAETENGDLIP